MKALTARYAAHDDHNDATITTIKPENGVAASRRRGHRVSRWLVLLGLSVVVSACATTRAETPRERPALDVPVPPPRVINPLPVPEPLPGPEPVGELPPQGTNTPARPRPQQRDREATTAKPEKPEEAKPVEPPPATAVTPPVPQLRIPETVDTAQLSAQIRDIVDRTRKVLDTVDYRTLTKERRKSYDDAKLFATQADEALKIGNLVFAKELADKAERLAKDLQGG